MSLISDLVINDGKVDQVEHYGQHHGRGEGVGVQRSNISSISSHQGGHVIVGGLLLAYHDLLLYQLNCLHLGQ